MTGFFFSSSNTVSKSSIYLLPRKTYQLMTQCTKKGAKKREREREREKNLR